MMMEGDPEPSEAQSCKSGASSDFAISPSEEFKSISDIDTCFGPTIREFLNVRELIPSLLEEGLMGQDAAAQLHTKLSAGQIQRQEACTELFKVLRQLEDDNSRSETTGVLFIECLKKGGQPENQILARFIEGTGRLPAHDEEEQHFRRNFLANLHKCRDRLARDEALFALIEVLGERNAAEIFNRGHDGSIERFLLLVFTLGRHPAVIKNPIIKYLNENSCKTLADQLGTIKSKQSVDEDDVRTFQAGFTSLGYEGDSSGNTSESLVDTLQERSVPDGTDMKTRKIRKCGEDEKDVNEKDSADEDSLDASNQSEVEEIEDRRFGVCANDDGKPQIVVGPGGEASTGERNSPINRTERREDSTRERDRDECTDPVETVVAEDTSDEKGAAGDECEKPEFYSTLRKYQLELAGSALKGRNSIIIAPTGTGKTHVAAYVINEHFRRMKEEENPRSPKVIFVVHTRVLADQQSKKLEELIGSQDKSITSATGDKIDIPLAQILRVSNVVVLTAQVLLNGLEVGYDQVKIGDLSLLIFDECHLCHKGHPFNRIMHEYHIVKRGLLKQKATDRVIKQSLPQIIGMTASIGTGKSKSTEKAFQHIVDTCANLDTEEVQTVLDKENLHKFLHIPEEIDPHIVQPKKDDKFKDSLEHIMMDIEGELKSTFEGSIIGGKVGSMEISCSGARDSQIYEAWVNKFLKESANITKGGDEQELVLSCLQNLLAYNRGLCLNRDVRMKDALSFLKEKFNKWRSYKAKCNKELIEKFDALVPYLENTCKDDVENPVLGELRKILVMEFEQKPQSRALLFTPTIQSTKALKDWIVETKEFDKLQLNPGRVTGATELTNADRTNAVRKFRSGEHKLLVVTNVVEQGMDIPECNLVIRLNYIPSDTGHIQVKGRNRAKGGKSYLVASAGHGNFKNRELSNRIREGMMGRLLEILKEMPCDKFTARVRETQDKNYKAREREETRSSQQAKETEEDGIEYTLKCGLCRTKACSSHEVVSLRTYHTVDSSIFVQKKIEVERTSKGQAGFDVGVVRCRKCRKEWGSWVKFENLTFAAIQINNFIVTNTETDANSTYRQWKDVAFQCREVDDLKLDLQKVYPVES